MLVIDHTSTDAAAQVVAEPRKGKGNAVQRLFQESSSDYLLPAKMREAGGDTICGCRVCADGTAFRSHHQCANHLLSRFIEVVFGFSCEDLFSGYRLFTRRFYRHVPLIATGFEVEAKMVMQTIDKRFVQHNVDVLYRSRPADSFSKLQTLPDGTRVIWALLTITKDCKPRPFFSLVSLGLLLACLLTGWFPIHDHLGFQYVYHVPLAILATGLAWLSALEPVLRTTARHHRPAPEGRVFLRMRQREGEGRTLSRVG